MSVGLPQGFTTLGQPFLFLTTNFSKGELRHERELRRDLDLTRNNRKTLLSPETIFKEIRRRLC